MLVIMNPFNSNSNNYKIVFIKFYLSPILFIKSTSFSLKDLSSTFFKAMSSSSSINSFNNYLSSMSSLSSLSFIILF